MNFDRNGNVISGFRPPTDDTGRSLSYEEYRERAGAPMTDCEKHARDQQNKYEIGTPEWSEWNKRYCEATVAALDAAEAAGTYVRPHRRKRP